MKSMIVRGVLAVGAVALIAAGLQAKPYAQLSSTETQAAGVTPKMVTLNATDAAKEIKNEKGIVTFPAEGAYFVIAAGQVGSTTGGKGSVKLWMKLDGKDVDNSNTEQTIDGNFTAVLVCQGVVEAKAGAKLELAFSATKDDQGLGLIFKKPEGEPAIPSMIFTAFQVDGAAYAQLSSVETQPATATPKMISMPNTDGAKGITNTKGTVAFTEAGTYFVIAAAQVGATAQGGKGSVRLWCAVGGKDVDNSNTEQSIENGSTAVLVCQGIVEAKAGDKLELMQACTGTNVGMVASTPKGEPAIPSMIFTAFRVDPANFAQLSSSESQPAAAAKAVAMPATDAAKGITNDKGAVSFPTAGAYFVIGAGQVGATAEAGKGSVKLWTRVDGKDVDNSNAEASVPPGFTGVLVTQGVFEAKAGAKLELFQSGIGTGIGMLATKPKGEPTVPSMIFTAFRVD
jgi:hypothetical protein